jgi:hypothetical protein
MAFKENKHKYADEEEEEAVEESTATLKKRWASDDDNDNDGDSSSSSSEKVVSSEEEPARCARSDDGDTTDSENNSIENVDGDTSEFSIVEYKPALMTVTPPTRRTTPSKMSTGHLQSSQSLNICSINILIICHHIV